jgi:UDPglucose 6-dehydrogenase
MTISIIGQGYVGLVSAAVFADLGNTVIGVDVLPERIKNLNKGIIPFYEPGLAEMVKKNVAAGRLTFTLDYQKAILPSAVIFICVGTPSKENGEADLSFVFEAVRQIAKNLNDYKLIVCKSTVPVGTNKKIKEIILQETGNKIDFDTASCPEFLREGTAIYDTLNPDRIIAGVDNKKAENILRELHKPIDGNLLVTNIETAEMIKYAANSFLAMKISFTNALAILSEKTGADINKVMDGVGYDKRIGREFLYPGIGYGGSCFPKDVKALIVIAQNLGYDFKLLKATEEINNQIAEKFTEKISRFFNGQLKDKTLAVWGLSFKPETDDMRDAPSIRIINSLIKTGVKIKAYDPQATVNAKKIFGSKILYPDNPDKAIEKADALLILTEWNEFKQADLVKVKKLMTQPVIFDGRNIYEPEKVRRLGFTYFSVGRN